MVTVRSGGGLAVNFQALHVLVWDTAVVPVSAAAGALLGWALAQRRRLA